MTIKSGYLNNPPKVVVIGNDNRPGSYPSHASPIEIQRSQGSQGTRPYRDNIVPAACSPYATGRVVFRSRLIRPNSTITLTSTTGKVTTFTFKNIVTVTSPYDISISNIFLGGLPPAESEIIRVIREVAQRFVNAVMGAPDCEISARLGDTPEEVILSQTIPGSTGNTVISTTISSAILEVTDFFGGSDLQVRYPYGQVISDSDPITSEVIRRVIKSERSGTLSAPGTPDPQRLIGPSDQHPYVNYSPYDESNAQQSFGVIEGSDEYGTQVKLYDEFFTRGSTLGPLDEPLSAKDKIIIDLTPVETTSIWHYPKNPNPLGSNNHQMMYYNFSDKKWDKLGFGTVYNDSAPTIQQWLDRHYIGFSQNCNNQSNLNPDDATYSIEIYDPQLKSSYDQVIGEGTGAGSKRAFIDSGYASPIDTFGFPFHPKYHATSSQTLDVSSIVDRPFLVEKITYEFSGSAPKMGILSGAVYYPGPNLNRTFISPSATFFILNQRKSNPDPGQESAFTNVYIGSTNFSADIYLPPKDQTDFRIERYENGGIPQNRVLSLGAPPTYVDSVRDLVTFARVGSVWPSYKEEVVDTLIPGFPHPAEFMDLAIEVDASGTFDGIYTLSSDVKSPSNNPAISGHIVTGSGITSGSTGFLTIYTAKDTSTRNSIDIPTGRSIRGEFNSAEIDYKITNKTYPAGSRTATYGVRRDSEASPYVIMPGDKLIFGWQSSFTNSSRNIIDPDVQNRVYGFPFVIGPGAGKLVLYGSYLRDDKPVHDIYKDQLISDSVHEAIPAGPAVLDMFDTEPTMVFSGSMREEFVTGTMFTSVGSTVSVTNPNDLTSVRMVVSRASEGNLGKRASFSRNLRLTTQGEQYYDSMQPNPLDVLMRYGGGDGRAALYNSSAVCLLSLPGELYYDGGVNDSTVNQISNDNFVGSFPFEPKYSPIQRITSINSRVLGAESFTAVDTSTGASGLLKMTGISFVTGSFAGDGSKSNLVSGGGLLSKTNSTFYNDATFIFIETSINDTNPIKNNPAALFSDIASIDGVNYHLSRFMGCFGSGYMGLIQYKNIRIPGIFTNFPSLSEMIYRGCKYGLVNPTPLNSTVIFNGSRFGHYRDMLEQRQFTVFKTDAGGTDKVPVEVKFIDRETGLVLSSSYAQTNSINLSTYCTSSLPYFDGYVRDRSLPLPESA